MRLAGEEGAMHLRRRTVRRLRRNALFLAALLAVLLAIVVAFKLAPRNDDTRSLRVPSAVQD
jgi:hypothetical protein